MRTSAYALEVQTTHAPDLLIYRLNKSPAIDQQVAVREDLIDHDLLRPYTAALVDFRDVVELPEPADLAFVMAPTMEPDLGPYRLAYLVLTPPQAAFVAQLQSCTMMTSRTIAMFFTEPEALRWLLPSPPKPL